MNTPTRTTSLVRSYGVVVFAGFITLLGAVMMTVSSSPSMKGAAFLWLPASLQLIAGVWLGPVRGMIAGGIGAYAAGILAYGGFGPPDIVMNLVAGGLANSFLPGALFLLLNIDASFGGVRSQRGAGETKMKRPGIAILIALILAVTLAIVLRPLGMGLWAYVPPLVLLLSAPAIIGSLKVNKPTDFIKGFGIVLVSCAGSAALGVVGTVMTGQTWPAAILGTGFGWFLGDTTSAILGLYALAAYTDDARKRGLAR